MVRVLCEGLRHELQLVGSKIKVSVRKNYKRSEAHFSAAHNTIRVFRFTLIHYLSSYCHDGAYVFKPSACMYIGMNLNSVNRKTQKRINAVKWPYAYTV